VSSLRRFAPVLALALALAPAIATAQPEPTQEAKDAARGLAEKGYELFEQGKYAEAITHFQQAEQRFHASPHLLFIARSRVKMGQLVEARDVYDKVVAEQLANYAPDAFRQAQAEARGELDGLRKRIPTIQLVVIGAEPESVRVTLDGVEVPSWKIQERLPANPGAHTVTATRPGSEPITRSVTLTEGAAESVDLSFGAPAGPAGPGPTPPPDQGPKSSLVLPLVAFGVGGLGLGIGAITGAMSLGKVSDIEEQADCIPDPDDSAKQICDPSYQEDADSARTLGTVSTVAFVVGGIGIGAGVILLLTRSGDEAPSVAKRAAPARGWASPSIEPRVGLGSIGVAGRF
jgi:tetratricopeptide (TPR) repeat protein